MIDEFAELDARVAAWKPALARHKELRETITAWYDEMPADQAFEAKGNMFAIRISPRELQRKIVSMTKVKAKLGLKLFLDLCSFTLKNLDAHIPTAEQKHLVAQQRTGHRSVTVIPYYTTDKPASQAPNPHPCTTGADLPKCSHSTS